MLNGRPRTWAERDYQVVHWSVMPRGGHFACLEQPELFVRDVRDFFRTHMGEDSANSRHSTAPERAFVGRTIEHDHQGTGRPKWRR
jgi:hypothetical protein